MTDYLEDTVKPLRRAHILRYLAQCRGYESNADILVSVINGTRDGLTVFYTDVIEALGWLENRGYVRLSGDEVVVVTATQRGLRLARGDDRDPGVAAPEPKA